MRYRLSTLLIVTTWAGLIFLGMRAPTPLWSGVITTVTLLTILLAVLIVVFRPGTPRALAIGYLVFCVGYFVYLTLMANWLSEKTGGGATSLWSLFHTLFSFVHPSGLYVDPEGTNNFTTIGHNAVACLLGLGGTIAAQLFFIPDRRDGDRTHDRESAM